MKQRKKDNIHIYICMHVYINIAVLDSHPATVAVVITLFAKLLEFYQVHPNIGGMNAFFVGKS